MQEKSEAFWRIPPSDPVCAASTPDSEPQEAQASVRIQARNFHERAGPRTLERRGDFLRGIRP